jgi:hypothetical protein
MRRFRIFTWHVHGSYLYYLAHVPHEFYLPVKPDRPSGYQGRRGPFPWPPNVHEVPVEGVRDLEIECVLFQSSGHYLEDQYEILSDAQRRAPRVYLEHDPPRGHPTDTRHIVDKPDVLLVHVTPFNALMWDCGRTPTCVIEHGVVVPEGVRYAGDLARGLVVVNGLSWRGRRIGADLLDRVRRAVPLDIVGMESEAVGGLGEVPHDRLPAFMARYRFVFHPVRYTSLALAVCEAMMVGVPIVGFATTELPTVVANDVSGYIDTSLSRLVPRMRALLDDPDLARRLGQGARRAALVRFGIGRFVQDWNAALARVIARAIHPPPDATRPSGPAATAAAASGDGL